MKTMLFLLLAIGGTSRSESMSIIASSNTKNSNTMMLLTKGAAALRTLALTAAAQEEDAADPVVDQLGILWLEHINLLVGSKDIAEYFYQDFLGFTRDPTARFHVNLGQQQFHLDEQPRSTGDGDDVPLPAHIICGSIGLVVPSLRTVRMRLDAALVQLKDTQFRVIADEHDYMTISCPFGNILHLYDLETGGGDPPPPPTTGTEEEESRAIPRQKMVQLHARGGGYSHATTMGVRGAGHQQPGIRYLEIACPLGTAAGIGRFYEQMLGCTVHRLVTSGTAASLDGGGGGGSSDEVVAVSAGPGVHLIFCEVPSSLSSSSDLDSTLYRQRLEQMKGVHICIYTAPHFRELYQRLAARGLIWSNPRFAHLDSCDTLDEALASRTLRFKDIVDLDTGALLLELEHETRPTRHGQYLKVPLYQPK
jgi:hypothetical protein